MVATLVNSTVDNTGYQSTVNAIVPSGVVSGDLLVAVVTHDAGGAGRTMTVPSGWTRAVQLAVSGQQMHLDICYRRSSGGEPATYQWGEISNWSGYYTYIMAAFRNTDPVNPSFDVGDGLVASGTSFEMPAPSVTPTKPALLITAHHTLNSSSTTGPSGMTRVAQGSNNTAGTVLLMAMDQVEPAGTPTGIRTATGTGSGSNVRCAASATFKLLAAGGPRMMI